MRHGNAKIQYLQESFFSKQALFLIYSYPFLYSHFFHFCLQKKILFRMLYLWRYIIKKQDRFRWHGYWRLVQPLKELNKNNALSVNDHTSSDTETCTWSRGTKCSWASLKQRFFFWTKHFMMNFEEKTFFFINLLSVCQSISFVICDCWILFNYIQVLTGYCGLWSCNEMFTIRSDLFPWTKDTMELLLSVLSSLLCFTMLT